MDTHAAQAAAPAQAGQALVDFLCFAIYSTNLTFGKAYKPILDELGLTYPQYIAIAALWDEDLQTVTGLGEKLFLESNTLTPVLKKLQTMGYVHRQRDSLDERQVLISLTAKGRSLRERAFEMDLSEACGLSAEEFAAIRQAVIRLRGNLRASIRK